MLMLMLMLSCDNGTGDRKGTGNRFVLSDPERRGGLAAILIRLSDHAMLIKACRCAILAFL